MTCANVLVGRVKDCEGIEIGRCWMGGRRCGYLCHSAKGATHDIICGIQSLDISIHAPVKGATPARHSVCRRISNFNPRSREGSDSAVLDQLGGDRHFNPRSREGSDFPSYISLGIFFEFQSTLPRRERRWKGVFLIWYGIFQSTLPRRERPQRRMPRVLRLEISIHAPAKGATAKITKTIPNDFAK